MAKGKTRERGILFAVRLIINRIDQLFHFSRNDSNHPHRYCLVFFWLLLPLVCTCSIFVCRSCVATHQGPEISPYRAMRTVLMMVSSSRSRFVSSTYSSYSLSSKFKSKSQSQSFDVVVCCLMRPASKTIAPYFNVNSCRPSEDFTTRHISFRWTIIDRHLRRSRDLRCDVFARVSFSIDATTRPPVK